MHNLRPRRNRKSQNIRNLVQENTVSSNDLIMPLFICEGENIKEEIPSLEGNYYFSCDTIIEECKELIALGIQAIALFPVVEQNKKNAQATYAYQKDNFYCQAIHIIKQQFPNLIVISDVALDPYNSDGHDGIVINGIIENDLTLEVLNKMSLLHAKAGADIIAPSDMMDNRVLSIRESLDKENFTHVNILSYAAKYASAFYGPFRDALKSQVQIGDKKTYQMNPANSKEALLECKLDELQGCDMLMIKPALPYLDIINKVAENTLLPVVVYNVSGEYAMLRTTSFNNLLNYKDAVTEVLTSFKRAGADIIITYHAKEFLLWQKK